MNQPDENPIRVLGGTLFFDGGSVKVANEDGWLGVEVRADESVKGYCVTVNGRSLPLVDEKPQRHADAAANDAPPKPTPMVDPEGNEASP